MGCRRLMATLNCRFFSRLHLLHMTQKHTKHNMQRGGFFVLASHGEQCAARSAKPRSGNTRHPASRCAPLIGQRHEHHTTHRAVDLQPRDPPTPGCRETAPLGRFYAEGENSRKGGRRTAPLFDKADWHRGHFRNQATARSTCFSRSPTSRWQVSTATMLQSPSHPSFAHSSCCEPVNARISRERCVCFSSVRSPCPPLPPCRPTLFPRAIPRSHAGFFLFRFVFAMLL